MKTSVRSRIHITKTGKLIRRKMGISHAKANKTGAQIRDKRKTLSVNAVDIRMFRKYFSKSV